MLIAAALGKELVAFRQLDTKSNRHFAIYAVLLRFSVVKYDKAGVFVTGVTVCIMVFFLGGAFVE